MDYNVGEINKGIVLQVKYPELLDETGGIIQGMSGSPILQNGKIDRRRDPCFCQRSDKGLWNLRRKNVGTMRKSDLENVFLCRNETVDVLAFCIFIQI